MRPAHESVDGRGAMTLEKFVFRLTVRALILSWIAGVILFGVIGYGLVPAKPVDVFPVVCVLAAWLAARVVLASWLRKVEGTESK
jgi:hypothetical protein